LRPPTVSARDCHGRRTGRLTTVTHVYTITCVTVIATIIRPHARGDTLVKILTSNGSRNTPARAGRHFSPQEQAEIAAARRVDVQALRERGMTMQAIAEKIGVSRQQTERDLKSSICTPVQILPATDPSPASTITPRQQEVLTYIRAHGPVDDKGLVEHFDGNLSIETRRVELLKAGVIEDSGERTGPRKRVLWRGRHDTLECGRSMVVWMVIHRGPSSSRTKTRCGPASVEPRYQEWDDKGGTRSLVKFVVSENRHRRHLTAAQNVTVAIEVLPLLEAEARERQRLAVHRTNAGLGREHEETLREIIPQASKGKASERAAELVGVNPRYISDGKRMKDQAPDVFEAMRAGHVTIPQARVLEQASPFERAVVAGRRVRSAANAAPWIATRAHDGRQAAVWAQGLPAGWARPAPPQRAPGARVASHSPLPGARSCGAPRRVPTRAASWR